MARKDFSYGNGMGAGIAHREKNTNGSVQTKPLARVGAFKLNSRCFANLFHDIPFWFFLAHEEMNGT
jgi:hypothetical protein